MSRPTSQQVRDYVADCAETLIEDDINESGRWTDEEHRELVNHAYAYCLLLRDPDVFLEKYL